MTSADVDSDTSQPAADAGELTNDVPTPPPDDRPAGAAEPILTDAATEEWPGEPTAEVPLPTHVDLPGETDMVNLLVKREALVQLWKRGEAAQKEINSTINNIKTATALLELVRQARNEIMAGKDHFEEADRLLSEVEFRIDFYRRMVKSARRIGGWLLAYEVLWLIGLGVCVALLNLTQAKPSLQTVFTTVDVSQFLNSLVWGGLGGVVGALYALWKHVADDQDFDSQYAMWYITNPVLGVALGAFVFLIIQAGFFSLTAGANAGQTIQSAAVIYVLAWICGFKQNVVYEIVRRILDVFRVNVQTDGTEKDKTVEKPQ